MNSQPPDMSGIGPTLVTTLTITTTTALLTTYSSAHPTIPPSLQTIMHIISAILILCAVRLWIGAVITSRIRRHIRDHQLITTGVYAIVRNPIYTSFLLLNWAALLWTTTPLILPLAPAQWLYTTLLIKHTEEKTLLREYGREYEDYIKKVNRCLPRIINS